MKKLSILFILLFLIPAGILSAAGKVEFDGKSYYLSNRVVIKFKSADAINQSGFIKANKLAEKLTRYGVEKFNKAFNLKNTKSKAGAELNKIYYAEVTSPYSVKVLCSMLEKDPEIEIAEPHYLDVPSYDPNDPLTFQQYHLSRVKAYDAWDVTHGSEDVLIAIVDTGVDIDHPDLEPNIFVNTNEIPNNGIDDDNNGYVDDVTGWDFGGLDGTPDNDPTEDRSDHGTHVAGCTAQATDNGINGAGVGFNCKLLPVKTARDDVRNDANLALIYYGYEGIVYAVDNGADIINCSWGGYQYSRVNQEVIDYAVENDVLVIAAAGNDGSSDIHFPSGYDGVIGVVASNSNDNVAGFSNYGTWVDVTAPGSSIYSTWQNDTYTYLSGTSMASPVAAGVAGLIKSQFPDLAGVRLGEQLRATCDNIDGSNSSYAKLIGKGRVNAFAGVSAIGKSVRAVEAHFTDNGDGDGVFESGEEIAVSFDFMNYLSATSSLEVLLSTPNTNVSMTSPMFSVGAVSENSAFDNNSSPLTFTINENAGSNVTVSFMITFNDGSYSDFQWTEEIVINPSYSTQAGNLISLTFTSTGNLGFNDYSENQQGDGFSFDGSSNLLFEGGLMYGTSSTKLVNSVRGSNAENQDHDFAPIVPFILQTPGTVADQQGSATFNDDNAGSASLNIETQLNTYSYNDEGNDKYIVVEYVFTNNSDENYTDFYAGLYFDWDIDEDGFQTNVTNYDDSVGYGYMHNNNFSGTPYIVGMAVLGDGTPNFYGIRNDGNPGVYDGYTDSEKYTTMSSGTQYAQKNPNDLSAVISGGPYEFAANDTLTVAFAIAADTTKEGLDATILASKEKYNGPTSIENEDDLFTPVKYSLDQNYPNPFNPSTTIKYSLAKAGNVKIKVFDVLGSEIAVMNEGQKQAGSYSVEFNASQISSGVYFYSIESGDFHSVKKMVLLK